MQASEWRTGPEAWAVFVERHPELGYRPGKWPFHNFLRFHRTRLIEQDAIRLARKRFWIAHSERFCAVAFECATAPTQRSHEGSAPCMHAS